MTDATQFEQVTKALEYDRQIKRLQSELKHQKELRAQAETELLAADARLAFIKELDQGVDWKNLERMETAPGGDSSVILVCTDWHLEQRVGLDTTNGANEFNLQIAEARVKRTWEKFVRMVEWARHFSDIDHIVVALLGDFINGYIHEEYLESNYLSPTQACLMARDLIVSGLKFIKQETGVGRIDVVTSNGNHGRTTSRQRTGTEFRNSFEWLTYNVIAAEFAGDDVFKFHIGRAYHNPLLVQGHLVRFHHGHNIKYWGGVGGLTVPVNKAISAWNKRQPAAVDVFGHWHQYHDDNNWVSVGCLVGYDEYAISIKADYQPPSQGFILMSRKYGKAIAAKVFCSEEGSDERAAVELESGGGLPVAVRRRAHKGGADQAPRGDKKRDHKKDQAGPRGRAPRRDVPKRQRRDR